MSFRELRNFAEMMKALGYDRIVSVENFRTPNFELVAHVLFFLVHRYDPHADISNVIDTQTDRITFLQTAATIMYDKANVRLNIKQLYKADGYAVKELLKIASLLYDAVRTHEHGDANAGSGVAGHTSSLDDQVGAKLDELQGARNLAGEIVESGSKLHTLLGQETEMADARSQALAFLHKISTNLESNDSSNTIERAIRQQISNIADNVGDMENTCMDLEKDQESLKQKIARKQTDLDRAGKRLKSLRKVRPAFMEEYEKLQVELRQVYAVYLERYRNVQYLESELAKYRAHEQEKKKESDRVLSRMQKRLQEQELRILRGEQDMSGRSGRGDNDDDVFDSDRDLSSSDDDFNVNPRGRGHGRPRGGGRSGRRGGISSDDSDSDSDTDTGSSGSSDDSLGSSGDSSDDSLGRGRGGRSGARDGRGRGLMDSDSD